MGFMLDGLLTRKASVTLQPAQQTQPQSQTYSRPHVVRAEPAYPFQAQYDPYAARHEERAAPQSRYAPSQPTDFFPPQSALQQYQMRYDGPSPDMSPRGAAFARSQSLSSQVAPQVVSKADSHAACTCPGHGSHAAPTYTRPNPQRSQSHAGFNMSQISYEISRTHEPEDLFENTNMSRGNSSFSSASSSPHSSGRSRSTSPPTSVESSRNVSRKGSRADMTKPLEQIPEVPAVAPLAIRKNSADKTSHWNAGFGWGVRKDESYAPDYQPPSYGQSTYNEAKYDNYDYRSKAPSVSAASARKPSVFASSSVPVDTVSAYAPSVAYSSLSKKPSVVASSSVPMDTVSAYAPSVISTSRKGSSSSTRKPSVVASSSVPLDTIPAAYRSRSDSRKPSVVAPSGVSLDTVQSSYAPSMASYRNPSIVAPSGVPLDSVPPAYAHSAMMERRPSDHSDSSGSGYGYGYNYNYQRAGSVMTTGSRNGSTVMYNGRKNSVAAGSVAYTGREGSVDKEKGGKQRRPSDWGSAMASFA